MARVESGCRLHFGFCNLSLSRERLYGSIGVALDQPSVIVDADPADEVMCSHGRAYEYTKRACTLLGVDGAHVSVREELPAHMGLGSGTQLALAVLGAVTEAHNVDPQVRQRAPLLGRGGRSGIGVAAFEAGGFVLDGGHRTEQFTTERPARGEWTVPPVSARHDIPEDWRFVLLCPDAAAGASETEEDESMRSVVERADDSLTDQINGLVTQRILPAIATNDIETFGESVADVGRLNGEWYANEQGGIYRPPAGALVDELTASSSVSGAGQSSWGPVVYGVTDVSRADAAEEAGFTALDTVGVDGDVRIVKPRNDGALIESEPHSAERI